MVSIREQRHKDGSVTFSLRWRDRDQKQRERKVVTAKRGEITAARKAAERQRSDMARRIDLGQYYEPLRQSFGEALDAYTERKRNRTRASTHETRIGILTNLDTLRGLRTDQVSPDIVEHLVSETHARAPWIAFRILSEIKGVLKDAREHGQPVDERVLRLKPLTLPDPQRRYLSWSEVERITEWLPEDYGAIVLLAASTGLRQGELFALRDTDIDFERSTLRVERTFSRGRVGPPKTRSSTRTVHLSHTAITILREQFVRRAPNRLGLVFPSRRGHTHIDERVFMRDHFRPALEHAGLGRVRFHDLRHTYAALMIASEAPLTVIQRQMGHESIKITSDVYGGLLPGVVERAAESFDRYIKPVSANKRRETS